MDTFYQQARFVVVPSLCFEMCPLVIVESMSQGLPVIASRIGGLAELVRDGETGLLFEPDNEAELAEKIQLLWHDDALRNQLARNARKYAESEMGDDVYYERLTQIYSEAARKHGKTITFKKKTPVKITD